MFRYFDPNDPADLRFNAALPNVFGESYLRVVQLLLILIPNLTGSQLGFYQKISHCLRRSPYCHDCMFQLHFSAVEFSRPVFDFVGFMRINPVIGERASFWFVFAHEPVSFQESGKMRKGKC
jgi:hypothetical protein